MRYAVRHVPPPCPTCGRPTERWSITGWRCAACDPQNIRFVGHVVEVYEVGPGERGESFAVAFVDALDRAGWPEAQDLVQLEEIPLAAIGGLYEVPFCGAVGG